MVAALDRVGDATMVLIVLIVLLCLLSLSPALAEKRVALVIGIDKYDNLGPHAQLKKARSDAAAVARMLRDLGFDVIAQDDVKRSAFNDHWQDLLTKLAPGDTAAFYFAGHGVEFGGRSYLLPRDVPNIRPGRDELLRREALSLQEFLADLRERGTRLNLVILDACRDNPFEQFAGRSVGGRRGLAVSEPPEGTFIMYSAGTGESALDRLSDADGDPNSVYTRHIIPLLRTPGLSLTEVAEQVRLSVRQIAATVQHRQTPAYYNQVLGRVCLAGGECGPRAGWAPTVLQSESAEAWAVAKDAQSIAALEAFIHRFGNTYYGDLAKVRLAELKEAELAAKKKTGQAVKADAGRQGLTSLNAEQETKQVQGMLWPGQVFRDCADVCPEMVVLPAGSFIMGSNDDDSEKPTHRVTIQWPFAVGKHEVTFGEWDACLTSGGCKHRPRDEGWGRGKRPVIAVSWEQITSEYLPWLRRTTGKPYRLLTEAEWEYAARAGSTTRYHFGDDVKALCSYANVADLSLKETSVGLHDPITIGPHDPIVSCRDGYARTAPVGSFRPNAFGLHDMHGNVWEWTEDCWNESHNGAPSNGSARTTGVGCLHVLRGGSWINGPTELRTAVRFGVVIHSNEAVVIGFRLGLTL
jgi:formylglycine-generating enzyme required for sulfatase activity